MAKALSHPCRHSYLLPFPYCCDFSTTGQSHSSSPLPPSYPYHKRPSHLEPRPSAAAPPTVPPVGPLNTARRRNAIHNTQTMRFQVLTALATLAATAFADVEFTSPAAGVQIPGGTAMTITWTDDGTSPTIDQFSAYTLNLMAGGATSASVVR